MNSYKNIGILLYVIGKKIVEKNSFVNIMMQFYFKENV